MIRSLLMAGNKKKLFIEFGANHRADGATGITMDTTAGSAIPNEEMLLIAIASSYDPEYDVLNYFHIDGVTPDFLYDVVDNTDEEHMGIFVGVQSITNGDYIKTISVDVDPENTAFGDQYIETDFRLSYCRVLKKRNMTVVKQEEFTGTTLYPITVSPIEAQKGDLIVAIMNIRHSADADTLNVSSTTHEVNLLFSDTTETYPRFKIFTIDVDDNTQPSFTFNATDVYQQAVAMYLIIRGN
ncbi:MAG TPA: hypothetical protein CFH81_00430 [Sulfurovum sp. UBA12169]|nr:MAG TPA: hypothetical protein CFH81_00430 [Sulfurovum sp. UBA12169]